jgi:hypothetical protein
LRHLKALEWGGMPGVVLLQQQMWRSYVVIVI